MLSQAYDALRLNVFLYPGITRHRSAEFLDAYYSWRRERMGPASLAFNALVWSAFWLWIPLRARSVARKWDKDRKWQRRIVRQAREWMTDPSDFAAFEIETEDCLRQVQRRMEQVPIIRMIESAGSDHRESMLDKLQFQHACDNAGLRAPRLHAVIENGKLARKSPLPASGKVLLKPVRGSGGKGIAVHPTEYFAQQGLVPAEYRKGTWLVQECVAAHPDISDLALDTLATLRVTTILDEAGNPEVVATALRYPVKRNVAVDNGHAGGLIAAMNPETGILGEGLSGWGPGRYPVHPSTGGAIAGRCVPDWKAALDLAREAHGRLYSDQVIIGWDIGGAEGGPVLIEANQRPAVRLTQRAAGKGIGSMRYGELVGWHLDRAMHNHSGKRRRFLTTG